MKLSLRVQGLLGISVLVLYLALIAVFIANLRQNLAGIVQELDVTQAAQGTLTPVVSSLAHSMAQNESILSLAAEAQHHVNYEDVDVHLARLAAGLKELPDVFPILESDVAKFDQAMAELREHPGFEQLAAVRDRQQELAGKLNDLAAGLQSHGTELMERYRDTQQQISVFAIGANLVGAVASVTVILVFFTRLAKDIKTLQQRAEAIVAGYDGDPLPITRSDEVGGLIAAVNRMQQDLRRWEQQIEIARQRRFHQEKMAAVGSLAAAIGHEVINPIAAISGVTQFMRDEAAANNPQLREIVSEFAAQILAQTERITTIMRQMSSFTAPSSPERELVDINGLIRGTCGFICYDKRFRGIDFEYDLCADLPAVTAVADHLTQILMNLLINAADALDGSGATKRRVIRVATRVAHDELVITVHDNGRGMTAEVLAKAFDESFTTKPAGKGRGIGLFVCKSLIEQAGGSIALESTPQAGTTATLFIPLPPSARLAA